MPKKELQSFLGTGWAFPPSFNSAHQGVVLVSEEEDIRQSLFLLFSTSPGERVMKPEYGCGLQALVFERLNASTENQLIDMITMAVLRYEPRIILDEIKIDLEDEYEGRIHIAVYYTIRLTNTRENIVYPFYFKEGTNVRGM